MYKYRNCYSYYCDEKYENWSLMKLLLFNWIFRLLFFAKFCGIFWTQKFNHKKYYPLNSTIKVIVKNKIAENFALESNQKNVCTGRILFQRFTEYSNFFNAKFLLWL